MMVRDDGGYTQGIAIFHLFHGRDAIIAGDDGVHLIFIGLPDQVDIDTIAILYPVGDLIIHLSPASDESLHQDIVGRDPVHIVI